MRIWTHHRHCTHEATTLQNQDNDEKDEGSKSSWGPWWLVALMARIQHVSLRWRHLIFIPTPEIRADGFSIGHSKGWLTPMLCLHVVFGRRLIQVPVRNGVHTVCPATVPRSVRPAVSSHRCIQVRYTTWVVLQFMKLVIDYVSLLDTPLKVWIFTIFPTMIAFTTTKNGQNQVSGSEAGLLTSLSLLVGAILKLIPGGFSDDRPYLPYHCPWCPSVFTVCLTCKASWTQHVTK